MGKGKRKRRKKEIHFTTEQEWIDAFTATPDDQLPNVHAIIVRDALAAGLTIPEAYERADGVALYLGLAVANSANYLSNLCTWHNGHGAVRSMNKGQYISMAWDYAEADACARFDRSIESICKVLLKLPGNEEADR